MTGCDMNRGYDSLPNYANKEKKVEGKRLRGRLMCGLRNDMVVKRNVKGLNRKKILYEELSTSHTEKGEKEKESKREIKRKRDRE